MPVAIRNVVVCRTYSSTDCRFHFAGTIDWKPLEAVENGIYLLREQDFSTRLRPTGQRDADMVVELFNSLIDTMKSERLKNMEQESFLQHLIEASPSGIAICDFNRRIVKCNPAYSRMVNDEHSEDY